MQVDSTARSYTITTGLSHNKKYTVSIQARTEYLQNSPAGWGEAATRNVSTLESSRSLCTVGDVIYALVYQM